MFSNTSSPSGVSWVKTRVTLSCAATSVGDTSCVLPPCSHPIFESTTHNNCSTHHSRLSTIFSNSISFEPDDRGGDRERQDRRFTCILTTSEYGRLASMESFRKAQAPRDIFIASCMVSKNTVEVNSEGQIVIRQTSLKRQCKS